MSSLLDMIMSRATSNVPRFYVLDGTEENTLQVDLPGVREPEVKIEKRDGDRVLCINGKRPELPEEAEVVAGQRPEAWHLDVLVPKGFDTDKVESSFEDCILTVRIPKLRREPVEPESTRIKVDIR